MAKKTKTRTSSSNISTSDKGADSSSSEQRDIITVDEVLGSDAVGGLEHKIDLVKVVAAGAIAAAALLLGAIFLGVAIYIGDKELGAWATGLISLVVGAAIGFIFGGSNNS